jgi:hypothetical protein
VFQPDGEFQFAGSLGFESGGGAGDMIVAARSVLAAESSTKVVPSSVQKLSQSSSNVLLQVGQRFIFGKTSF